MHPPFDDLRSLRPLLQAESNSYASSAASPRTNLARPGGAVAKL